MHLPSLLRTLSLLYESEFLSFVAAWLSKRNLLEGFLVPEQSYFLNQWLNCIYLWQSGRVASINHLNSHHPQSRVTTPLFRYWYLQITLLFAGYLLLELLIVVVQAFAFQWVLYLTIQFAFLKLKYQHWLFDSIRHAHVVSCHFFSCSCRLVLFQDEFEESFGLELDLRPIWMVDSLVLRCLQSMQT